MIEQILVSTGGSVKSYCKLVWWLLKKTIKIDLPQDLVILLCWLGFFKLDNKQESTGQKEVQLGNVSIRLVHRQFYGAFVKISN